MRCDGWDGWGGGKGGVPRADEVGRKRSHGGQHAGEGEGEAQGRGGGWCAWPRALTRSGCTRRWHVAAHGAVRHDVRHGGRAVGRAAHAGELGDGVVELLGGELGVDDRLVGQRAHRMARCRDAVLGLADGRRLRRGLVDGRRAGGRPLGGALLLTARGAVPTRVGGRRHGPCRDDAVEPRAGLAPVPGAGLERPVADDDVKVGRRLRRREGGVTREEGRRLGAVACFGEHGGEVGGGLPEGPGDGRHDLVGRHAVRAGDAQGLECDGWRRRGAVGVRRGGGCRGRRPPGGAELRDDLLDGRLPFDRGEGGCAAEQSLRLRPERVGGRRSGDARGCEGRGDGGGGNCG